MEDTAGDKDSTTHRLHPSSCLRKKSLDYVLAAMSNLGLHRTKSQKKTSLYDVSFATDTAPAAAASSSSRRSSSPCSHRLADSMRSPSPSALSLEERPFRSRSYSLPLKLHQRRRRSTCRRYSDWPILRSPSSAEQRFLSLPESAYYQKLKAYGVDDAGNIVERGFCYVHKSDTNLAADTNSPASDSATNVSAADIAAAAGGTTDAATAAADSSGLLSTAAAAPRDGRCFKVHIIGEEAVGRSSLVEELKNLFVSNLDDTIAELPDTNEECIIPILVEGVEYSLSFRRANTVPEQLTSPDQATAVIVMYDVTRADTFSAAADIMYVITSEVDDPKNETYVPMLLIGNKVDLERHRAIEHDEGKELAKSYGCAFLEISVLLGHQVQAVLQVLLNELRPSKKMRRKRSIYRARKRSRPKNVMAKSEFHKASPAWFDFLRKRHKCMSLESLF